MILIRVNIWHEVWSLGTPITSISFWNVYQSSVYQKLVNYLKVYTTNNGLFVYTRMTLSFFQLSCNLYYLLILSLSLSSLSLSPSLWLSGILSVCQWYLWKKKHVQTRVLPSCIKVLLPTELYNAIKEILLLFFPNCHRNWIFMLLEINKWLIICKQN